MTKNLDLDPGDIAIEAFFDATQEFIGAAAPSLQLSIKPTGGSPTVVQAVATGENDQQAVAIQGRYRYITATAEVTLSGGAGVKDIYVGASDNAITPGSPSIDNTVYAFTLHMGAPGTALSRKVGEAYWDGAAITELRQTAGARNDGAPLNPVAPRADVTPLRVRLAATPTAKAFVIESSARAELFSISAAGAVAVAQAASLSIGDASLTRSAADTLAAEALDVTGQFAAKGTTKLCDDPADTLGFFGSSGAARTGKTYSVSNVSSDRTYDANSTTVNEIADILGTLISDLQSYGLIG